MDEMTQVYVYRSRPITPLNEHSPYNNRSAMQLHMRDGYIYVCPMGA